MTDQAAVQGGEVLVVLLWIHWEVSSGRFTAAGGGPPIAPPPESEVHTRTGASATFSPSLFNRRTFQEKADRPNGSFAEQLFGATL